MSKMTLNTSRVGVVYVHRTARETSWNTEAILAAGSSSCESRRSQSETVFLARAVIHRATATVWSLYFWLVHKQLCSMSVMSPVAFLSLVYACWCCCWWSSSLCPLTFSQKFYSSLLRIETWWWTKAQCCLCYQNWSKCCAISMNKRALWSRLSPVFHLIMQCKVQ